jgi:uncharacterized protein DUF664
MDSPDAEAATLIEFLDAQRASVHAIIEDLPMTALNAAVLPSGWTPLGLIEHLGHAERHWFQDVVTGSADDLPWTDQPDAGDEVADVDAAFTTARDPQTVLAFYREQCRRSNEILAATPLSATVKHRHGDDLDFEFRDARRVALHLIEETARHAGHLDAARELIDGVVGRGPR